MASFRFPSVFIFLLLFWNVLSPDSISQEYRFDIQPSSQLKINGTSNINEFTCDCMNYNHAGTTKLNFTDRGDWNFKDAILTVRIDAFDCGNSAINRDMGKALKSDKYPSIIIELKSITRDKALDQLALGSERSVIAYVNISLAGERKQIPLYVNVKRTGPRAFHMSADKDLFMSDFGVTPPTALFGLIKVNDLINISFDLDIITTLL